MFNKPASWRSTWIAGALLVAAATALNADITELSAAGETVDTELDVNRIVSSVDMQTSGAKERYLRCWQSGRLIIDETGWDYLPTAPNGRELAFGVDGKVTKRLFVNGETTCLYSNEVSQK